METISHQKAPEVPGLTLSQLKINKDNAMTIPKKFLLIASIIMTANLTQAGYMLDFDYKTFHSYVDKATTELNKVSSELQPKNHNSQDIMWTGQSFADALYPQQKAALKAILEEIKLKDTKISMLFESEVYNGWKRTFKNNYDESLENNDPVAWKWLHESANIFIHE